jgi:hypothetical protein
MGNLRDQLKNAKLMSDKRARQLAHDERVHRKEAGREGLEKEREQRDAELRALREEDRERTAHTQAELDRAREQAQERAACEAILQEQAFAPPGGGRQRFHFEVEGGDLPWLELDEGLARRVRAGEMCIVRSGAADAHVYRLLATDLARRVAKMLPGRVAWAPRGVLQ